MSPYIEVARKVTLEGKRKSRDFFSCLDNELKWHSKVSGRCSVQQQDAPDEPPSTPQDNCMGKKIVPTPEAALMG